MYQEALTIGNETFQRLSISKADLWGDSGSPELPYISKRVAIPECDSIIISCIILDSIVLNSYNVYPKPEIVEDSITGTLIEQFTQDSSVYQLNMFMPERFCEMLSEGYFRNQRVATLAAYPIRYNPITQQLIAYTSIEITLTFQNAHGDVNISNGLFSNITQSALINYSQNNDKLPPYPVLSPGEVEWLEITDTAQAYTIDADYLIIADDQFVNPHSAALQNFANHRSTFNGFKVTIVSSQNILENTFYFDPNHPEYQNEQKIRSFIKRVYEGGHALHTYDGKVAFILLAGDANENLGTQGVPASKDPDPTGVWDPSLGQNIYYCYNDYYYTCVTQDPLTGQFDLIGDIFIGRFSADHEAGLYNIVHKTIKYENEIWSGISNGAWRKQNILAYGWASPGVHQDYFCTFLQERFNSMCLPTYQTNVIDGTQNRFWNRDYTDWLNNDGCNLVIDYGHGNHTTWLRGINFTASEGALTLDYKIDNLTNEGQWPFVIANACVTGMYTNPYGECIGEKMTVYSSQYGYVASLASYKDVGIYYYSDSNSFPKYIYETVPYAIYHNLSTLIGESILEGRMLLPPGDVFHFQWNLFGDPALNLMAAGYELTHDVTLSGITIISTPVCVRENTVLTFATGAEIHFEETGQLIIEDGSKLVLSPSVKIMGKGSANKIQVFGQLEGIYDLPNPPDPIPVENLTLSALPGYSWSGFEFNNPSLHIVFDNCSFSDCLLTGVLDFLEIRNGSELTSSFLSLNETNLVLDNSVFTNTAVRLTNYLHEDVSAEITGSEFTDSNRDILLEMDHYPDYYIDDNIIHYNHGIGIGLFHCGAGIGPHTISNNTIEKSGNNQELSWGVKIYHTFSDLEKNLISNNRFGIVSLNQSSVNLIGDSNATVYSGTQQIIDNYQNQVKTYDNSFPLYFHYNIIQNTSNPGNTVLIHHDPVSPPPAPIETGYNIKCNCFDQGFNASSQLYPSGWYIWSPTWYPSYPPQICDYGDDPGKEEFEAAISGMDSAEYSTAEAQFKEVIIDYPGSPYAIESVKKLIPLKRLSDNDFSGLKIYYDTTSVLHEDSLTDRLIYRMKNQCDVEMENFENAVSWYENDIQNPLSLEDSVYSLIDLSDTYLLMAADSNMKSSHASYTGTLAQYKPKDITEHTQRRYEWFKLLFKNESSKHDSSQNESLGNLQTMIQNFPNPFSNKTELSFTLSEESQVSIIIANLLGQIVQKLERSFRNEGKYSIILDLTGKPDGIYFITLYANNKEIGKLKALKTN